MNYEWQIRVLMYQNNVNLFQRANERGASQNSPGSMAGKQKDKSLQDDNDDNDDDDGDDGDDGDDDDDDDDDDFLIFNNLPIPSEPGQKRLHSMKQVLESTH